MHNYLKTTYLWIKEYKHPLRIVGGILFFLALVSGVFWIAGNEIEPLAFVLGMLSSLFLASPSVAEYFLPNRKPVRYMSLEEILDFIPTTDPIKEWHGVSRDWSSEMYLREDPRLRFRAKFTDDGIQQENFVAKWANKHPDSSATGYWYELYYDGAFLDRIILVAVDGTRAMIPPPEFKSGKISLYNYHVAKIHDTLKTLDEYIKRSKLKVEDS